MTILACGARIDAEARHPRAASIARPPLLDDPARSSSLLKLSDLFFVTAYATVVNKELARPIGKGILSLVAKPAVPSVPFLSAILVGDAYTHRNRRICVIERVCFPSLSISTHAGDLRHFFVATRIGPYAQPHGILKAHLNVAEIDPHSISSVRVFFKPDKDSGRHNEGS